MGTPVLDKSKPHGTIMVGAKSDENPGSQPRFAQNGHYFRADGTYHSSDVTPARKVIAPKVAPSLVQTLPSVDEAEVPALLADARAEPLRELPRDELIKLVQAANGPVIAGDKSTDIMVAWLVKNTKPDDL